MGQIVAVVQYNAGNTMSVSCALNRLGIEPLVTDDPAALRNADKVIFPGVGEAKTAMDYLQQRGLDEVLVSLKQPFLGICLGLQLMCSRSEENNTVTLGIFPEEVRRFPPREKVPHMGWNTVNDLSSPLFKGIRSGEYFYFVHGYYAAQGIDTIASTSYILPFSAALRRNNFYGTQFHPEKSGEAGERVLKNFLSL